MIYQTLKYCLARACLTIFLLLTLGFFVLYSFHEIALPQRVIDDAPVQWMMAITCIVLGFLAPGAIAERRMFRAIRKFKDIDLASDEKPVLDRFERLFCLTYSFYFLPAQGEWFRRRLVPHYADYLMAIGREDPDSMKIYLKAFLLDPQDSKFRVPLLAALGQGHSLANDEIDLLAVMLKVDGYRDAAVISHLASIFLEKRELSLRSEPVFLKAVENKSENAERIIHFVVPFLLQKERSDRTALIFYLHALPCHLPYQEETEGIIGRVYCDGRWRATDNDLHEQCGRVFSSLHKFRQDAVARSADENRLSARLKKVKLFSREDKTALNRLKADSPLPQQDIETFTSPGNQRVFSLSDLVMIFRSKSARFILAVACLLLVLVLAEPDFRHWKAWKDAPPPPLPVAEKPSPAGKSALDGGKVYTVQVAAVFSQSHVTRIMNSIREKGVEGLYVDESKRAAGGSWYKIRVGKFADREEARQFAEDLMGKKIIKNYFIISVSQKQGE